MLYRASAHKGEGVRRSGTADTSADTDVWATPAPGAPGSSLTELCWSTQLAYCYN